MLTKSHGCIQCPGESELCVQRNQQSFVQSSTALMSVEEQVPSSTHRVNEQHQRNVAAPVTRPCRDKVNTDKFRQS
eukprot:2447289-Alexandrium_andersonii.AAC.1